MLDVTLVAAHNILGASLLLAAWSTFLARFRRPSPAGGGRSPRLSPCSRPAGGHPATHHPSHAPAGGDVSKPATYTIDRSVAYRARLHDHHRSLTPRAATCLRTSLRLRIARGIGLQRHLAAHGRLPGRAHWS